MLTKKLRGRDFISLRDFSKHEVVTILETALSLKQDFALGKPHKLLDGKTLFMMFFNASTRTRNSFTLAAGRLSADVIEFTKKSSSVSKGETLLDTARNLEAMGIDIVVIRHNAGGAPKFLSRNIDACVVNAGDGYDEHPTQALLDAYTIRQARGSLKGLKIGIVGDIAHSRVARSDIWAMMQSRL